MNVPIKILLNTKLRKKFTDLMSKIILITFLITQDFFSFSTFFILKKSCYIVIINYLVNVIDCKDIGEIVRIFFNLTISNLSYDNTVIFYDKILLSL